MQMEAAVYSLPASLLRQHTFCPRIPFYNEFKRINPGGKPWLTQGVLHHQRQQMLTRRRNLTRYGLSAGKVTYQLRLSSSFLGVHGICDAVIESEGEFYPLEFKLSPARPLRGHYLQLAAYALMLEECQGTRVRYGFILYGDRGHTRRVDIDQWRGGVKSALKAIRANLSVPLLPPSPAIEAQCGQCEYLNFCADRF